ncbi:MAG: sugar kinase [Stackebrandtia sp.]
MELLAIGETMVMVTPEPGGRLDAESRFRLHPGGAESNLAAHLARLGHHAAWAGAVGSEPLGDLVLTALRRAGVDLSPTTRDPARPTGVYFKDPREESTNVYYYRRDSAAAAMDPERLASWTRHRPSIVHVTGITPALSPGCRSLVDAIVHERAFGESLVSFDVNHRPALWSGSAAPLLLEYARAADIVFVGRDEAERLWGTPDTDSIRDLIPAPVLVVKDGANEAVSFEDEHRTAQPAAPVRVVDVVGAGDAFAAGWLSGYLNGQPAALRLRLGHYVAGRVIGSANDAAELPNGSELAARLATPPIRTGTRPRPRQ